MAIYGNFKGTTQSSFKIGKSGKSLHATSSLPVSADQGDLWFDSSNSAIRIYDGADWDNGQFIGNLEGYMEYEAQAGENLVKGDVVYVSGNSGNIPIVSKAQANAGGAKMPAFGICTQTINTGNTGYIVTQGLFAGVNTSAFTSGDTLYVSATTAGAMANVSPSGEDNKIQNIGKVVRSSNGGSIIVGGAGRFNATNALDSGNIFLGDSSDRAVTANLDVSVGSLGFVKSNPGIGGFVYNQSVAASVWSVSHNLGQQYVNVEIIDDTGNSITGTYGYPTINFVNANQLTATFSTPTAGYLVASSGQGYTGSSGAVGFTGSQGFTNFTLAGDTGSDVVNSGETVTMVGASDQIETTVTNNQLSIAIVDGANIANLTVTGSLSSENISTTGNVDAGNINLTNSLKVGTDVAGNISGVDVLTAANVDAGNVNVTDAIVFDSGSGGSISGVADITASGNIGIGTASPASRLFVSDTSTTWAAQIQNTNGTDGAGLFIRSDSTNNPMALGVYGNGSYRMVVRADGNVGINTASPWSDAKLTVDNGGSGNASIALSRSGAGQNDVALVNDAGEFIVKNGVASTVAGLTERMRIDSSGSLLVGTNTGSFVNGGGVIIANTQAARLKLCDSDTAGTGASDGFELTQAGTAAYIYQNENDFMAFGTNATERMRIDSSGNVGIGDSNPPSGTKVAIQHDGTAIRIDGSANTTKRIFFRNTNAANPAEIVADGSLVLIAEDSGMHMEFKTANTERMRITATGNTLMGLTSDYYSAKLAVGQSGGNPAIACRTTNTSGTVALVLFTDGNSQDCGSIDVNTTANTTNYGTSSDQRLKENIVDAPSGNIDDVRVRSFDWKSSGHHQTYGLVAQELVDVAPEAVSQGKKEEDTWKIDYSKLVPMMIKEIQDLKAEVAALKGA
jgi:hypothetical protein